ncbi:hypothetical protein EV421DRAFT_1829593 [Armillaria borealis]|uniref:DUF6535 domain-containing protein n=1 Tax=Armillaria borealis TaxID=47425 RepID=A0AA39J6K4_9AGAR|nr:hypothetical protein EV421DRAFT_1829593 [Armillaria borealis]
MDWMFRWSFLCGVTTFVAQTSQSFQVSTSLLFELINVQRAAANGSFVNDIPSSDLPFLFSSSGIRLFSWENGHWFISLSFSLTSALFAVLNSDETMDPPVHGSSIGHT